MAEYVTAGAGTTLPAVLSFEVIAVVAGQQLAYTAYGRAALVLSGKGISE